MHAGRVRRCSCAVRKAEGGGHRHRRGQGDSARSHIRALPDVGQHHPRGDTAGRQKGRHRLRLYPHRQRQGDGQRGLRRHGGTIDLETGIISGVGANKSGEVYEIHPMTGKRIPGTQIPYWDEVKAMCLKAMHVVPQVRFVAWDVAITPTGPVFIEGNSFPSPCHSAVCRAFSGWNRHPSAV